MGRAELLEDIVKRRLLWWPSSEIYGGVGGSTTTALWQSKCGAILWKNGDVFSYSHTKRQL